MVTLEKSQPAPTCLEEEKKKVRGDYKCRDVLERLKTDFKNKCYLCETSAPSTINVEHFLPHEGNLDLKFNWDNLFWACGHCNNTKLNHFKEILNCTKPEDQVETVMRYAFKPFPFEDVEIEVLEDHPKVHNTRKLLWQFIMALRI